MDHPGKPHRAPNFERFASRPTPDWFRRSKLGIFVHWGPYSVPAWAEPVGRLGEIEAEKWFLHNPYAEWYFNTIRFENSPARKHHKETYGDAPYDDFIDAWTAEKFDPEGLVKLFKKAGASFVVPVTKHHDGVTLWSAPGDGGRNTVERGPKRDLVQDWARACSKENMKLGLYYSTGLDWHLKPSTGPYDAHNHHEAEINQPDYNEYCYKQCEDLISKYKPHLFWGDITWSTAGIPEGPHCLANLLDYFYKTNPKGLINDRFGNTHWDFTTKEYSFGEEGDDSNPWQYTSGIGLSFGYNQMEQSKHSMSARTALRLIIDVASRGGNTLLNVGPDAAGTIPSLQMKCLEGMADWMAVNQEILDRGMSPGKDVGVEPQGGKEDDYTQDWVRWLSDEQTLYAFVDGEGNEIQFPVPGQLAEKAAKFADGRPAPIKMNASSWTLDLAQLQNLPRPIAIAIAL